MTGDRLAAVVPALLSRLGRAGPFTLEPVPAGGNNRVFRLRHEADQMLLKAYFHHPGDPRDRMGAEWAFLDYAAGLGIDCVPRPLACDAGERVALHEFIEGTRPAPGEIGGPEVEQALAFLERVNQGRQGDRAHRLPAASEAAFTVAAAIAVVDRRVTRLSAWAGGDPAGDPVAAVQGEDEGPDRDAAVGRLAGGEGVADHAAVGDPVAARAVRFVMERLTPAWHDLRAGLDQRVAAMGGDDPLDPASRCLSPSDFGFHNALRRPSGALAFLDFEYAGWDDPAKLVADFFAQPAVPVPATAFDGFARRVAALTPDPGRMLDRIRLLSPLYRFKWCCIMLNEFLPVDRERRVFAAPAIAGVPPGDPRETRLDAAAAWLDRILGER